MQRGYLLLPLEAMSIAEHPARPDAAGAEGAEQKELVPGERIVEWRAVPLFEPRVASCFQAAMPHTLLLNRFLKGGMFDSIHSLDG
jgi:hypothetical protein